MRSLSKPVIEYASFLDRGAQLLSDQSGSPEVAGAIEDYLGASTSRYLEALLSREERAADGVFFSGSRLATYVAGRVSSQVRDGATIGDPTCGAGDLLLACLLHAKLKQSVAETVKDWSRRVAGLDINADFTDSARLRLLLLARKLQQSDRSALSELTLSGFDGIRCGDYLQDKEKFADLDVIVTNPPFGEVRLEVHCPWGKGKVQRAGLFLWEMIVSAKVGQHLVAVLPDVLRSGTRYAAWRKVVEEQCVIHDMQVFGKFDSKVDVDVFVIHIQKSNGECLRPMWDWTGVQPSSSKVSDYFKVSVGPVVPHRHKGVGPWVPYLTVPDCPPFCEVKAKKKLRFSGTLHKPPFLVVRRTSSPSDRARALATIVRGKEPVAVENHLLVLKPRDGLLRTCSNLMAQLNDARTSQWMNVAIRCRHLTKRVVEQIPFGGTRA
jgi:hypothetical protein